MAIEERYATETKDAVLERMKTEVSDEYDKRESSHAHDMLSPAAIEFAKAYIALDQVLTYGFLSEDTPREYLELKAAERGVIPTPATKSTGELTFSGDDAEDIPAGTRVSTDEDDPIYAVTTADASIPDGGGEVTVEAEAEEAGAVGDVSAGEFTLVRGDLSGVLDVTNAEAFEGGADEESDESLLARTFERVREPATSGNVYHYEQWAKEVPGIEEANVEPVWDGPGTVRVVLISDEMRAPDQTTIDAATDYIEEERPFFGDLTVVGVEEVEIDVTADVQLTTNGDITSATNELESALTEYFAEMARNQQTTVRYAKVGTVLFETDDVLDYDALNINGGTDNISITSDQVAVVGTVTLNDVT
ncbi:baseplate J/gp47 family protein [Salibacterium salarium]|uniref:Baseplate J/gp47 family protein n=1 Tax=Salibacterium salarium TaxID=284579 RepID=A0A428MSA4_9BACI|nr:baseplate J/gp47 family protein [Salibacterium salarium]RSL28989.1 baseplate J/gp47 family protein [Salibacterium salarium]